MTSEVSVTLCTCPPAEAVRLAGMLVDGGLAACVNVLPSVRSKLPAAGHEHLMLPIGSGEPPCHLVGVRARRQPCQVHRRGACHEQLQQPLGDQEPHRRGARASRLVLLRSLCLRGCTR